MSCTTLNKLQMLDYDSKYRVDRCLDSCQIGVAICLFDFWNGDVYLFVPRIDYFV